MLREIISSNIDIMVASTTIVTKLHPENLSDDLKLHQQKLFLGDWKEPTTFMAALERLEGWIYSKVMESIWWQVCDTSSTNYSIYEKEYIRQLIYFF